MRLLSCFSPLCRKCPRLDEDAGFPEVPPHPPIMESYASEALTNAGPVQILSADAQPWRVASPQDQPLLSQLSPGSLIPLTWIGEGAYGCVELCRVSVAVTTTATTTPRDDDLPCHRGRTQQQQPCGSNAAGEYSTVSQPTADSYDDPFAILRSRPAAQPSPPTSSATAAATIPTAASAAGASEPVLSPREEVIVRPGRFSVNRLRLFPPQPHDPPAPSPCATPLAPSRPTAHLARLHLHHRHGPLRSSAPAATSIMSTVDGGLAGGGATSLASPAGGTSAAASGVWPMTPSSTAGASAAAGACGVSVSGGFPQRACSSGSTAAASSAPPSARSPRGGAPPPASTSAPPLTPSAAAAGNGAASMVRSNELVVAVKRVGYRGPGAARAREPDGCVACTGGAIGRGGRGGPSRTRLNRMQAIELLQLARCRECPFIVRVFGCVPDEPKPAAAAAGGGGVGGGVGSVTSPTKQSPRPGKLSPRRPPPPASSSSSSSSSQSCRIVMEWAEGGDLGSLLKALAARRGPNSDAAARERLLMSESSARFYLACLLEALSFLHAKGLLHRDVKPANLLLTSDGRAKLGDLGMVCHLDRAGLAAGRAGTPNYMAPEVWAYGTGPKFSSYGANVDLWSAGVVLHELLTGHLPGSHPDEYLRRNWTFSPRHTALSPELRDLLGRLLSPRPRRRLQSCAEVAAHSWFAGFDWQGLRDGTLPAPYVPAAHRPAGSAGATAAAAAAAAARLRQAPGGSAFAAAAAAQAAAAAAGTVRGPGGGAVDLMPPLPEENWVPVPAALAAATAAAAAGARGGNLGASATAAVAATSGPMFRSASAGTLRQSGGSAAPAAPAAPGAVSALAAGGASRASWGWQGTGRWPSLGSSSGAPATSSGTQQLRASSPAVAAPASGAPASVWRSLGWPAVSRPMPAAVSASTPVSAASSLATALAAAAPPPRRCESHGPAHGHGSDGAAVAAAASGGGGSGGGFGFLGAALASAFAPVLGSPRSSSRAVPAATTGPTTGSGNSSSSGGKDATAAAGCGNGGGGGGVKAGSAPRSGDSSAAQTLTSTTNSCETSALFLSTAGTAGATTASDCPPRRNDSGTTTTTAASSYSGCVDAGQQHISWQHSTPTGACLTASPDSQATAAAVAAAAAAIGAAPTAAPLLSISWTAPLGYRPQPSGRSAGGAGLSGSVHAVDPSHAAAAGRKSLELVCASLERAAAAPPQHAMLSALASLQQHVQGLGPAGRRAGCWLHQRLADAAALAVALPDQLQSAAAAAATAAVRGGGARVVAPVVDGRACRSEGGACSSATPRVTADPCRTANAVVARCAGSAAADPTASGDAMPCVWAADLSDVGMVTAAEAVMTREPAAAAVVVLQSSLAALCDPESSNAPGPLLDALEALHQPRSADGAAAPTAASPAAAAVLGAASSRWATAMSSSWRSASGGGATPPPSGSASRGNAGQEASCRPASSPGMLQAAARQLSGQRRAFDLTRQGSSDAATVLVLVRRSTGCGGAGTEAGEAVEVKAAAKAGELPQLGCAACGAVAQATASHDAGGDGGMMGKGEVGAGLPRGSTAVGICARQQNGTVSDATLSSSDTGAQADATVDCVSATLTSLAKDDPTASPPPARPRTTDAHKRTSSFCFDPLEQGRPAGHQGQRSASPPVTPLPPPPSAQQQQPPSSGCGSGRRARSPSFSFDVDGLLSTGLALSASPVLLLLPAGATNPHTSSTGSRSGTDCCSSATTAAAAAAEGYCVTPYAAAAATPPAPFATEPLSPPAAAAAGSRVGFRPRLEAATAAVVAGGLETGCGALGHRTPRPGGVMTPVPSSCWQPQLQWQAGEAAALMYAACVAVLVMAWAVIREGGAEAF